MAFKCILFGHPDRLSESACWSGVLAVLEPPVGQWFLIYHQFVGQWVNQSHSILAVSEWVGCGALLNYWWPAFWLKCRVIVKVKIVNLMHCGTPNMETNVNWLSRYVGSRSRSRGQGSWVALVEKVKPIHGPQFRQIAIQANILLTDYNEPNIWFISK